MHILLIHQAFVSPDEAGGTRHFELARALARRGHRVTVIASKVSYLTGSALQGAESERTENGIRILRAYTYTALHRSFVHRVIAFASFMISSFFLGIQVRHVDLVWGTSPPIFQGWTAWMLARLKRVPFLFEVRDLWPSFAIAVGVLKNHLLIGMSLWLEAFLYHRADRVVVNSPGYAAHVRARGARRVELIPNGTDPDMFRPMDDGREFRTAHSLVGKYVVLYAGAHGMSNDLNVVLDCAQILIRSDPAVQIVLLGDGKEKPTLLRRMHEMSLTNVTFLPPVSKNEIPTALAGADACLAILKPVEEYKTTYPNKVFDYMAAGRPIILVIDGVIRQVVEAAGCGVFSTPGDPTALARAIRSLAGHPEEGKAMGLNGRRYVEANFNRSELADRLAEIIEEMVHELRA